MTALAEDRKSAEADLGQLARIGRLFCAYPPIISTYRQVANFVIDEGRGTIQNRLLTAQRLEDILVKLGKRGHRTTRILGQFVDPA